MAALCLAPCVQSVIIPASAGSPRRQAEGAVLASQRGLIFDSCGPDLFTRVTVGTMVGIALLYFAATCALLLWKLNRHKRMPYRQTQVGTVFFRLQVSSQALTRPTVLLHGLATVSSINQSNFKAIRPNMTISLIVCSISARPHKYTVLGTS